MITEVYDELRSKGYVADQYAFDEEYLGRNKGYFAYLKSTNNEPSTDALMRLHFKLRKREEAYKRYGVDTGQLDGIARNVLRFVEGRCLA